MSSEHKYVKAPEQDVVLASRVRIYRNFKDLPFTTRLDSEVSDEIVDRVKTVMLGGERDGVYTFLKMSDMNDDARGKLLEHDLIDENMLHHADVGAVLISSGSTISVMMVGDDHLGIQGRLQGLQSDLAAQMAYRTEESLSRRFSFAFDSEWGYLCSNPNLTGTGMRACVLLHLPAITRAGRIADVLQEAGKAGLVLRNTEGDGRDMGGHLFRLYNQTTLGKSEEDVLASLSATAADIVEKERMFREAAEKQDMLRLQDVLLRSCGEVTNSRVLNRREWIRRWSDIRYAVSMGYIHMPLGVLDELLNETGPASLQADTNRILGEREQDILRSAILREKLPAAANEYME